MEPAAGAPSVPTSEEKLSEKSAVADEVPCGALLGPSGSEPRAASVSSRVMASAVAVTVTEGPSSSMEKAPERSMDSESESPSVSVAVSVRLSEPSSESTERVSVSSRSAVSLCQMLLDCEKVAVPKEALAIFDSSGTRSQPGASGWTRPAARGGCGATPKKLFAFLTSSFE